MKSEERQSHSVMAYELGRMIKSKLQWLETFSSGPKKYPDHTIENKRLELAVLQQAETDYRRASERKQA